jgi:hypothetical protein
MRTIAVFVNRNAWWAWFAKLLTKVEGCSHCAVVHPMTDGSYFVSDMTGKGFALTPYEEWIKHYTYVASYPITIENNLKTYDTVNDLLNDLIIDLEVTEIQGYSQFQILLDAFEVISKWIGLGNFKFNVDRKTYQVCSEWVARYYDRYHKWPGDKYFDLVTLRDCRQQLSKICETNKG